jgi:hypothetical protein
MFIVLDFPIIMIIRKPIKEMRVIQVVIVMNGMHCAVYRLRISLPEIESLSH